MPDHVPPQYEKDAFHCPHCHAFAQHKWSTLSVDPLRTPSSIPARLGVSACAVCGSNTVWRNEERIWPLSPAAPGANADLPDDCKSIYEEAREIAGRSPRGAAALVRLALQKLLKDHFAEHGAKGKNINDDIKVLVEQRKIDPKMQMMMDSIRIVGNHAVHPGEIDPEEDPELLPRLFEFVNLIVDQAITQPNKIKDLYDSLPESAREQVERRNGSSP